MKELKGLKELKVKRGLAPDPKHLSGITRSIGAPKWGIRSRTPL
jgi:hypothetical protein